MKTLLFSVLVCASLLQVARAGVTVHQLDENVSFQAITWQDNYAVASGTAGGIYLSGDDGASWQQISAPTGSDNRQFRDNQRLANGRLVVMSAGEGPDSGVFISDDNGKHWQQVSQGQQHSTFYDCFYMTSLTMGWLYGDSDEQGLFVLATTDGGLNWQRQSLPIKAQSSEGGFASSGTCLNEAPGRGIVIGTGNGDTPRLLMLEGNQWQSIESPIAGGEAGGIFSVQATVNTVFVSGGSLKLAGAPASAWQYFIDSDTWQALPELPLKGAVYGSALLATTEGVEYWVSNPQGVAVLTPGADKWQIVSQSNIWSLACQADKGCIGVGKNGVVELYR
ncbi:MAG: hypothetical protein SWN10_06015 [Pseudomonadota bacterium]|nr:hypothetical protein [Pseudomonadota bacterium]